MTISSFYKDRYAEKKNNPHEYAQYLEYLKKYRELHRKERNIKDKQRKKKDPLYRMACDARSTVLKIINRKQKRRNDIIGCNWIELKDHIEKQFKPGMTWDNHGLKGWHIDHIIPLNISKTIEETINLCHYTNLQPLWHTENIKKGKYLK